MVFSTRVEDAAAFGFNELRISNRTMKRAGASPVELVEDVLREEGLALFRLWSARSDPRAY